MMNTAIPQRILDILEWPSVGRHLEGLCSTGPGKHIARTMEILSRDRIISQMSKISELRRIMLEADHISFAGITDIEPLVRLAEKNGVLTLEELAAIKNFIIASQRIKKFLKENLDDAGPLSEEYEALDPLKAPGEIIIPSITDTGELSDKKYPHLRKIRDSIHETRNEIQQKLSKMIASPALETILQEKVYSTRNDRYVILVKANMKGKVKGSIHDISSSGATVFIEPDSIAPLNNNAIMLERELQAEIYRILAELSLTVGSHADTLIGNLRAAAYLDFLQGSARQSIALRAHPPEIADAPMIELYSARHPLLALMNPEGVVANDVHLGTDSTCLIISGANTGGKTVLLKTIGLCALMTLFGLHVPAGPDSKMGLFTGILADIGDDQSIAESLSTFSGQIMILKEMIERASSSTLVIIDEIIVGTNPRQGASLARAVLERLIDTGCRIVVTTHYSELKEMAASDPRCRNASVSFDLENLSPTYRLTIGIPGVSYALEIARTYGIDEPIIARARELLSASEVSMEALLEKMQKYGQEIEEEKGRIAAIKTALERERALIEEREKKLRAAREELKEKQGTEFYDELKSYRKIIAERITKLQEMDLRDAGRLQDEIIGAERDLAEKLHESRRERTDGSYPPIDPTAARPGDRVFVTSLQKTGTLESIDPARGWAEVLLGNSMRSRCQIDDLRDPGLGAAANRAEASRMKKARAPIHEPAPSAPLTIQTSYNTIDLRGLRVDEAIAKMNSELDAMSRSGIGTVIIIHGHGTGALKQAVRDSLGTSFYADSFRRGSDGEGGDGVTVVQVR